MTKTRQHVPPMCYNYNQPMVHFTPTPTHQLSWSGECSFLFYLVVSFTYFFPQLSSQWKVCILIFLLPSEWMASVEHVSPLDYLLRFDTTVEALQRRERRPSNTGVAMPSLGLHGWRDDAFTWMPCSVQYRWSCWQSHKPKGSTAEVGITVGESTGDPWISDYSIEAVTMHSQDEG